MTARRTFYEKKRKGPRQQPDPWGSDPRSTTQPTQSQRRERSQPRLPSQAQRHHGGPEPTHGTAWTSWAPRRNSRPTHPTRATYPRTRKVATAPCQRQTATTAQQQRCGTSQPHKCHTIGASQATAQGCPQT